MSAWVGEGNINLFNKIPKFRKLVNFDILNKDGKTDLILAPDSGLDKQV